MFYPEDGGTKNFLNGGNYLPNEITLQLRIIAFVGRSPIFTNLFYYELEF